MPHLDNLRTLRENAGLKKTELAASAGISTGTITNIEKHNNNVSREMLIKVINALNRVYYNNSLDPEKLITEKSRFGGNTTPITD